MPRTSSTPLERRAIACLALVGVVGALLTHAEPTANGVADVVVTAALAGAVVVATALARPWAWIAAGIVVGTAAAGGWLAAAAVVALLGALGVSRPHLPHLRVVGALAGALLVQVLLRLPAERFAENLAGASAAILLLALAAWPALGPTARGRLRRVGRVVGVGAGVALLGLAASLVLARAAVQRGIDRADDGLDAAREGDGAAAADHLAEAGEAFASAHGRLDAWWAKPALLLPGVGPHARALEVLTEEGAHLAVASATAAREARIDDLRVVDGRLDLDQVRAMADPLAAVQTALRSADRGVGRAESPWLLPPVASRLGDFQRSITSATEDAATAAEAVAVLPDLLGASGERRYFVVFATPAEARDLGGFMGAYGILQAVDGELSLRSTGRVRNLNIFFAGNELTDPEAFSSQYLAFRPEKFWQNVTATPDFPTTAEAVHQLWTAPGRPLDGVLYLDPQALAMMLELTGPIRLPGYDTPLTAATAAPFLLRDQYVEFPDDDRHDFLVEAATTVFESLTTGDLPGPRVLADTLAPAVRERRLLFHSFRADEQALFERLDVDGALPPVRGDFLSVRSSNRGRSKIDAFMRRSIAYDVLVDPAAGTVRSTVTVTVANDAPAAGLPETVIGNHLDRPDGTSSTTVSVLTPLELVDVRMDGESIGRGADLEHDRNRYSALVDIPAGGERTVTFVLEGRMDLRDGYHLDVVPQPLVTPDRFELAVEAPSGWAWHRTGGRAGELREDQAIDVSFFSFGDN